MDFQVKKILAWTTKYTASQQRTGHMGYANIKSLNGMAIPLYSLRARVSPSPMGSSESWMRESE
jgi:hypothetical protein